MDPLTLHRKNIGKLDITSSIPIDSKEVLSAVYTPGVGEVCKAIEKDPELLREYTIAGRTVAVISNGTAVLGFGAIGPKAALPVMEGKSAIFKEFAGIQSYPICIEEEDPDKFIEIVKSIAMNFAAINLEDISAPSCFYIEDLLSQELDIPVIHDDQHGTAIVTVAALLGAVELTKKTDLKIAVLGAGAAGTAITKLLIEAREVGLLSITDITVYDSKGSIDNTRKDLNPYKQELAKLTKQTNSRSFQEGISGCDVLIGVSVANSVTGKDVRSMAESPIVFALANPVPEVMPAIALEAGASIVATGRSDMPNQINNALAYPGVFKGLLDGKIRKVTSKHKIAAAEAIYKYHLPALTPDSILPSVLDKDVAKVIATAIIGR